jgi:predicted phage terminase large subunit-like protein
VWHAQGDNYYLLELIRDRFDFPDLKRAVLAQKQQWPEAHILIEDRGSGTSLIQELRRAGAAVIPITAKDDKVTRLYATQPRFESGVVHFPAEAPWLDELVSELLAFPHGHHDDQVDSVTQALTWMWQRRQNQMACVAPIIISIPRTYVGDIPDYF